MHNLIFFIIFFKNHFLLKFIFWLMRSIWLPGVHCILVLLRYDIAYVYLHVIALKVLLDSSLKGVSCGSVFFLFLLSDIYHLFSSHTLIFSPPLPTDECASPNTTLQRPVRRMNTSISQTSNLSRGSTQLSHDSVARYGYHLGGWIFKVCKRQSLSRYLWSLISFDS